MIIIVTVLLMVFFYLHPKHGRFIFLFFKRHFLLLKIGCKLKKSRPLFFTISAINAVCFITLLYAYQIDGEVSWGFLFNLVMVDICFFTLFYMIGREMVEDSENK